MHLDRISWLFVVFGALWVVLCDRTFQIQIVEGEKYSEMENLNAR